MQALSKAKDLVRPNKSPSVILSKAKDLVRINNTSSLVILSKAKDLVRPFMSRNYNFYVYILSSESGALYIGVTNNLERRLSEHKHDLIEGFSKRYKCHLLVYYEHFTDIKQAIAREKYLKGKKRSFKVELINSLNPKWDDLSREWQK